ncbi:hypothetical protein MVI27_09825 [Chryseobacterium salipaludis]|uniref:hypothetical protein n=1 Tax=Chryseobacterium TaxID=59732 RepID=UPI001FF62CBA|nr:MULTISPECIES: hypothetical protein [Chryseobacterium]MCJ8498559.1 hypothetical protein [Chryseobacterium salipaludis]MCX3297116.1 hypothetical protein [Planobacterium sp. JC490]
MEKVTINGKEYFEVQGLKKYNLNGKEFYSTGNIEEAVKQQIEKEMRDFLYPDEPKKKPETKEQLSVGVRQYIEEKLRGGGLGGKTI